MDTFSNFSSIKPKISIVPEQESPPSFLTPREVLELVVNIRQITDSNIDYWLEFFELETMEGRVCRNLSRGQKQKVMLASAFISETKLMFLDEPFINLDPLVQAKVREWLKEYVKKEGLFLSILICSKMLKDCVIELLLFTKVRYNHSLTLVI